MTVGTVFTFVFVSVLAILLAAMVGAAILLAAFKAIDMLRDSYEEHQMRKMQKWVEEHDLD